MKNWIVLAGLLACAAGAAAQECVEYEDYLRLHAVSPTGGSASSLLQHEGRLYLACRELGLYVYDVFEAGSPLELNQVDVPGLVWDMDLGGDHLYLASGSEGLQVVSLEEPDAPEIVGSFPAWSWFTDVMVYDDVLLVADYSYGLFFFDISDPEEPLPFFWQPLQGFALGLALYESVFDGLRVACCAIGDAGLETINFADLDLDDVWNLEPDDIVPLGLLETEGYARDVTIHDGNAYICNGREGLLMASIIDPADMLVLDLWSTGDYASRLKFDGENAFLADGAAGLRVFDVAGDGSLDFVSSLDAPGWGYDVVRNGDFVYVANGEYGLRVVDAAVLEAPPTLAALDLLQNAKDIAIQGDVAYVAAGGLHLVDISDPENPELTGSATTGNEVISVAVQGPLVCTGTRSGLLRTYSAALPGDPVLLGQAQIGAALHDLAIDGDLLAAADTLGLLRISLDEEVPSVVQRLDTPGRAKGLAVLPGAADDLVYVADGTEGVRVYRLAEDGSLAWLARHPGLGDLECVALDHPYLYAGDADRSVQTYWIDQPNTVGYIGRRTTTGPVRDLLVDDLVLVVAQDSAGVQLWETADPWAPRYLGSLDTDGRTAGLAMGDGFVAAADGSRGLLLFLPQCQSSVAVEPEPAVVAAGFELLSAAPNPFNPSTTIRWRQEQAGAVRLAIHDLLGRELRVLRAGPSAAGEHELRFDAEGLASGLYFARLSQVGASAHLPLTLIK